MLKTKDNVDHAGPSPPLELLKDSNQSKISETTVSLNNNLLTAPFSTEI
jgi:hypothetical protein